jgi:hypothetical protein
VGPPISSVEFRVYQALVAAICKVYGLPVSDRVRDHREVTLPFGRKAVRQAQVGCPAAPCSRRSVALSV